MFTTNLWGHSLLTAGMVVALLQCLLPLFGYWKKNIHCLALAKPLALLQAFLLTNAFLLLVASFVNNDFSLAYVAQNSHPNLPFFYRLTAAWGAHEGSFLLWIFMLNLWTVAVCFCSKYWNRELRSLTLALLGFISFCFLIFLNYTSSPFIAAQHAIPQDLNPLLQDPGFFVHPPMLYAGYVGFSVVFAFTIAWLISFKPGEKAHIWASIARPWTLAAWSFLTIGITLGSWWAYHVLGWGGFWFWDPVENASLLPWLTGAALLHLVIVIEKQGRFLDWGIILAILTFSLSILGTFLVRSGILISVHSFAHDPSRGIFLLMLLALITGSALFIYIVKRLQTTAINPSKPFFWSSREAILLIQSIFLFVAMATVLLGTLYPMIMEATGLGSLSIGPPYFNKALLPLLIAGLMIMGWAAYSQWSKKTPVLPAVKRNGLISIALSIMLTLFFTRQWHTAVIINLSLVFWVLLSISNMFMRHAAMMLAHLGFALVIMAIVLSSAFTQEREIRLLVGENVAIGPYVFHFIDVHGVAGSNFKSVQGNFAVLRRDQLITHLQPEKRIYTVRDMVMTKAAIYPAIIHDLYISLGEPLSEDSWSLRLYYKPFIRWVWLGGFCIALGGFISLLRYAGKRIYEEK